MVMVKIYIFIFEFFPPGTPHLHHPNIMVLLNTGMIEADTGTREHGDTEIIIAPLRSNHLAIMQCPRKDK